MEAVRQRALVRASAAAHKKEGASSLTPKGVSKGTSKQKSDGKDNRPLKKGPGIPTVEKQPKQLYPPKPSHGAGEGPMMSVSLPTHKEHVVKMIELIIRETDLDLCAE